MLTLSRRTIVPRLVLAVLGSLALLAAVAAHAQESGGKTYREDRNVKEFSAQARLKINSMFEAGKAASAEEQQLFEGFLDTELAKFTWSENREELPKMRQLFKRGFLSKAAKAPALHEAANRISLEKMSAIALSDEYHPVVRHNCMLLVGALDAVEPDFRGAGAVPYRPALPVLVRTMEDSKQIEAVRVAALVGVRHHAETEMVLDDRRAVFPKVLELVRSSTPPSGTSKDAHQWMRLAAVQIVGLIAEKGAQAGQATWPEIHTPETVDSLRQMMSDTGLNLLRRSEAAYALGKVEGRAFQAAKLEPLAIDIGTLARDIGAAGNMPADHLTYFLHCCRFALNGVSSNRGLMSAADTKQKTKIGELTQHIEAMIEITSNSRLTAAEVARQLKDKGGQLNQWLEQNGGIPVAAGTPAQTTK